MSVLGWGAGGAAWSWRRQLWPWEEAMVEECRALLSDIVLQPYVTDRWVWRIDPGGGYSVRGAYDLLTYRDEQDVLATTDLVWHKQVPLKVSVVVWRLLRNRLPTKDNLVRRHVITSDSHFSVTGCGGLENAHHLFLSCPVFAPLWSLIRSWVGISSADPLEVHDHFVQFAHSAGSSRARRSFLQLLWLCDIWVVWHERNNIIFKAKKSTVHEMLDKVKTHLLWWMKAF
ncbi:kinesin-like protein [Trifolium medium]|uniref:Kinesin-like protein n=1 Tax=Trifolium medium TaxID=97028 RepID=A0A392MTS1_9FABA|nr:kinesin-like protein [Trifolium medium]